MRLVFTLGLALLLGACNYNKVKQKEDDKGRKRFDKSIPPDFNLVFGAVIGPKCATCHSNKGGNVDGVNLETYENVRAKLNRVLVRSLETPDKPMPPRPQFLTEDEKDMLEAWDKLGAPKDGEAIQKPGEEGRGPANWQTVRDKIFAPKCFDCHNQNKPDKDLDLTKIEQVREKFHLVLDRVVRLNNMPLEPYPAVTSAEKKLLLRWFELGMPE